MKGSINNQKELNFTNNIEGYLSELKNVIDCLNINQIQIVIEKMIEAYHNEKFIFVFGNGGSASTASHLVTDFNKGISGTLQKKFRVICLNDNIPTMLAVSNDIHYHQIFKHQLENYLSPGDLVIGISGSGNSSNVIEAIEYANSKGAYTIGLVGFSGGKLKELSKYSIHVPVHDMQQVEDVHLAIHHLITRVLMAHLGINSPQKSSQLSDVLFSSSALKQSGAL